MLRENPPPRQKSWVGPTYRVTIIMLVIGQIQVSVAMEITPLKEFLADRYYLSLVQFVVSFLSIQLYGFFYHIIVKKPMWVRLLAGLWTYEVNTMSIMKPAKRAPYISLILSIFLTFLMMIISVIYGNSAIKHKKGLFVILWSERIFVLTCFGIIVCAEMKRVIIEFPTLLVYTILSSVFVIVFGASMRKPNFYRQESTGDYILIGQLYYLNFFALYMGYVWTTASFIELMGWRADIHDIFVYLFYRKNIE
uniref:Uncharacterized protein, isoform B n=1 Tax=Drosophila melanogaster TaxID=7227 RepID=A0A0B4LF40_DROME|nr:uncharacterized protein Dmel_CG12914, isoform B [Drosophila melanogaster]AHN56073.1 uncharacterized protein Dmel_CG12914, isoform B [Drosophila melanogaster]|eukprot:NP_001286275.1 uncharacterized protein Dmel_CG12914, isoform B [Drosophila melanogaster]